MILEKVKVELQLSIIGIFKTWEVKVEQGTRASERGQEFSPYLFVLRPAVLSLWVTTPIRYLHYNSNSGKITVMK